MLKAILPIAALFMASSVVAQDAAPADALPALTLEQQTNLRCGVAFAGVAGAQEEGAEWALAYPALGERGKEFFVRTMARMMEDERFTRSVVLRLAQREVERFAEDDLASADALMPACIALLDASGL